MQAYDSDKRKLLSALCHGSIFISVTVAAIGIPIAILLVSDDPIVKENAKEAMNFHLNVWLWGAVLATISFLTFGLLGFFLAPIYFLIHWTLSVLAILHCLSNVEKAYRYPLIFRIL